MRQIAIGIMCLLAAGAAPVEADTVTLVAGGKPAVTVVLPQAASPALQLAAAELNAYVQKLSGVVLPLQDGDREVKTPVLRLGDEQAPLPPVQAPREQSGREAFSIRVQGGSVYFGGRSPEVVAYAVYAFVEESLGVRWFAPGELWEALPPHRRGELAVEVTSRVVVPDIPLRIWSGHAWNDSWRDWDRRNRASSRSQPVRQRSGNQLQGAFPVEVYGQTHPEYYPLINGRRFIPPPGPLSRDNHFWPCSSNPEVAQVAADFIRHWFDEDPEKRHSFSLGMNDVTKLCQCAVCQALDPPGARERNNYSDRNYAFVNAVAREIKKTHPDHYLGVLIYRQLRQPPQNVPRMESNVYGFLTQNCGTWWRSGGEQADRELSRDWANRFSLPLVRYEYYGLGSFAPRFYPHTMDRQIKFDRELGFEGNYTEVYTFLPHSAPMIWAFSKLQWDASLSIDALLQEFYEKMFGTAAPTMAQYYSLLERAWNTPRMGRNTDLENPGGQLAESRNRHEQILAISPEEIRSGLALLDRALGETNDPRVKQRLDIIRSALVFSQHGIETGLLNEQLRGQTVGTPAEAGRLLGELERYARMSAERERFWAEAKRREDLLGETLRHLGDKQGYLVTDEFPQMDTSLASVALEVLDWYGAHEPGQVAAARQRLAGMPWPPVAREVLRAVLSASDANNLLANAGFEAAGATPTEQANADWTQEGAPDRWSLWLRSDPSRIIVSSAGVRAEAGRGASRGVVFTAGQGGALIQSLPASPGEKYLATTWMRATAPATATAANLHVTFRDAEGRLFSGADRRANANKISGVPAADWQRLVLSVTVPPRAVALVFMVGADPCEAAGQSVAFDDPTLQRVSAPAPPTANLITNPDFEGQGTTGWEIRDWGERKGDVALELATGAYRGQGALKARLTAAGNVVLSPSLSQPVRGAQKIRFSCWYKLPGPGQVHLSVLTRSRSGKQLQYLDSPPGRTVGQWAELTHELRTDADTHSLLLYLRPTVDGALFDEVSLVVLAPAPGP